MTFLFVFFITQIVGTNVIFQLILENMGRRRIRGANGFYSLMQMSYLLFSQKIDVSLCVCDTQMRIVTIDSFLDSTNVTVTST